MDIFMIRYYQKENIVYVETLFFTISLPSLVASLDPDYMYNSKMASEIHEQKYAMLNATYSTIDMDIHISSDILRL